MAKARNSDLTRATHKGRRAGTGARIIGGPSGSARNGRATYAKLTASALTNITPTPQGREIPWPYGYGSTNKRSS